MGKQGWTGKVGLQAGRFSILKMKGADGYEPDYTALRPEDSYLIK